MNEQFGIFKANLETFAFKHKKDICEDPIFRADFQKMCEEIGVYPIASKLGIGSTLSELNDFYYELAIQIINICMALR